MRELTELELRVVSGGLGPPGPSIYCPPLIPPPETPPFNPPPPDIAPPKEVDEITDTHPSRNSGPLSEEED